MYFSLVYQTSRLGTRWGGNSPCRVWRESFECDDSTNSGSNEAKRSRSDKNPFGRYDKKPKWGRRNLKWGRQNFCFGATKTLGRPSDKISVSERQKPFWSVRQKTKIWATKFKMWATKFRNGATKLFTSQLVLQRGLTGIRSIENEISSQFVLASENFVQANVKFISAICRPFRSAFRPGSFRRCG